MVSEALGNVILSSNIEGLGFSIVKSKTFFQDVKNVTGIYAVGGVKFFIYIFLCVVRPIDFI